MRIRMREMSVNAEYIAIYGQGQHAHVLGGQEHTEVTQTGFRMQLVVRAHTSQSS
jgi:hypothetical protein